MLDEKSINAVRKIFSKHDYIMTTAELDSYRRLFPDAVLCMETALFYYQYSDRNPAEWNITIDKNVSRSRTNIDYPSL